MTTLYLVRHGEYENPDYVFPSSDRGFPLSQRGKEQVRALIPYFAKLSVTALYASPVTRTRETAEILGGALGLTVRTDERLKEVRTNLEGTSMKLFDETRGELSYLPEHIARGAETMDMLSERVYAALEDIRHAHTGGEVIVVTHGDPLRFGLMKYLGLPMDFDKSRAIATPLAGGYKLTFANEAGQPDVEPIEAQKA